MTKERPMNVWTQMSIDLANQQNYLDMLFRVYPTIPEDCRDIDQDLWKKIEISFSSHDNEQMIRNLLHLELFPIKDSYVAYLKRDPHAVKRNPETVNRLAGRIFDMGLTKLYEKCSVPKETNRQIGPLFKRWISKGSLGIQPVSLDEFEKAAADKTNTKNLILYGSDREMMQFAKHHLGYKRDKGLDFLGRFNGKYVIGEAKFLTDFGEHQNAQFSDAVTTLDSPCNAVKIAILDGVCYIPGNGKIQLQNSQYNNKNIMSALVLREFLYQL